MWVVEYPLFHHKHHGSNPRMNIEHNICHTCRLGRVAGWAGRVAGRAGWGLPPPMAMGWGWAGGNFFFFYILFSLARNFFVSIRHGICHPCQIETEKFRVKIDTKFFRFNLQRKFFVSVWYGIFHPFLFDTEFFRFKLKRKNRINLTRIRIPSQFCPLIDTENFRSKLQRNYIPCQFDTENFRFKLQRNYIPCLFDTEISVANWHGLKYRVKIFRCKFPLLYTCNGQNSNGIFPCQIPLQKSICNGIDQNSVSNFRCNSDEF